MQNLIIYESAGEHELFAEKLLQDLTPPHAGKMRRTVFIDDSRTYQEIDGFGASFTDSAAYLIHQVLTPDKRAELMARLFDPREGIGLSVLRNPMGASDYARDFYTYDDMPSGETDPELKHFSIRHDEADIIPLLKEALRLNPDIKLIGSPWSPPGWMKTSGSMIGGRLIRKYFPAYAEYFVRYIQAYAGHGINIYAVTPQNEPMYSPGHYPGMLMPPGEQAEFIKHHLRPAFDLHKIGTKILCYDHNWNRPGYPRTVLKRAHDEVDGVAWHWYGGKPSAQSKIAKEFPDKEVHFTEGSGGEWIPPFEPAFSHVMRMGIEILRNHSRTFVLWNMALDENNGPFVPGFGKSTCRGVVRVDQRTGELTYTLDYYALAHFSKCIRPGAKRIESASYPRSIRSVACRNKDGSIAVVLFNECRSTVGADLVLGGRTIASFAMKPKSAVTVLMRN